MSPAGAGTAEEFYGVDHPLPRNVNPFAAVAPAPALLQLSPSVSPYLPPAHVYRYSLRRGMRGHEVFALQVLLNQLTKGPTKLVEDGAFGISSADGGKTEAKLRGFQKTEKLTVDGVCGPATQRKLAERALTKVESDSLLGPIPHGLLKGQVAGESGYIIGAANYSVPGGVDCGLVQQRVYTSQYGSLAAWRVAFGYESMLSAAGAICDSHDQFRRLGVADQRAWELAMLNHNWPWGASQLAHGRALSTAPAQWVIDIGVHGVRSPAQWAEHYIDAVTTFVVW